MNSDPTSIIIEEQMINNIITELNIHNKRYITNIHTKKQSCKNIPSLSIKMNNTLESVVTETNSFENTSNLSIISMIALFSYINRMPSSQIIYYTFGFISESSKFQHFRLVYYVDI